MHFYYNLCLGYFAARQKSGKWRPHHRLAGADLLLQPCAFLPQGIIDMIKESVSIVGSDWF